MEAIYSRELGIKALENTNAAQTGDYKLSSALKLYHRLKGIGKSRLFFEVSTRSIHYLEEYLGHDNLFAVKPLDAGHFSDSLFARGLSSSSVKRVFSSVGAIVNLAIREHGLAIENIFSGNFIPDDGNKKQISPIPNDLLTQLQSECRNLDDESRWLIALIIDTGMRLSEACRLHTSDIKLNTDTPHINLIEHPWRKLKTNSSSRQTPLVGTSLWAAKQVVEQNLQFAFPKYCNETKCNANSGSAALNKWLKQRVSERCVIHSFRHSLKDRLRAVECPEDIIDAIGRWTTEGVGHQYGKDYSLGVKAR